MDALLHGGAVARSGALDLASTDRRSHDRSAARTYYTTGELDARGVYAFVARRRESLPQLAAHDLGGPPSHAGSDHGLLGNSQVGAVPNGTSGGTAAGGTSHRPAYRSWRCDASSHDWGRWGGWRPPYEARETKVFSSLEHELIRLACGLDPANYDAGRPPIYAVFLADEVRSMVKVQAILQKFLAPAPNDWDPISVYASQELVRDMKNLKFGWGNENAHDTSCHRGISPFNILQVSTDQQTKCRKNQERSDRATYLSTDDVRALEAKPGCCPASYHWMLNLLKRYIRLLMVLFGVSCSHLTEVQGVYQVHAEKIAIYETISAELIAETLWRVFVDARECFSYLGPGLPESIAR